MIKTEELQELIKTIFYTGYVSGEKPLSAFIIGNVGIGKSELISSYEDSNNIAFYTDLTYMGLLNLFKKNREVRHIIIPDFLKITMKGKNTTNNVLSLLNSGMEEGIREISLMGFNEDFKNKRIGLISSTTRDSYYQNRKKWESMGFLSRCLIITYDYKDETKEQIFDYIFNRDYLKDGKKKLELPVKNIEVKLSRTLAKRLRDKTSTFRSQKQLQTLAMARAIINNPLGTNFEATDKEINEVIKFTKFMNMDFKKI
jgi:hypothetical protein